MRKELASSILKTQTKVTWLQSQMFLLQWELERHFQSVDGVFHRCDGIELDDTCEDVLGRNPAAKPGIYHLSGAQTDEQQ
jgi:hypothetical protein